MSLEIINENALQEEKMIQQFIFDAINATKKIVFKAGAGSGKTYALIESLRYIITHFGDRLARNNQRIICVTYTNVAVSEIRERLGQTDLVIVSTIHERLWDLINNYQKELVIIHKENLEIQISELDNKLNGSEKEYSAFQSLGNGLKTSLKNYLLENEDLYYRNFDKPAAAFRASFGSNLHQYGSIMSSVANFKKIASAIIRIARYEACLSKIARNDEKFRKVEYNSKYNNDRLHRMQISHDTLIEYAHKMFARFGILRRVVIDKHPYFLIDEYQDTNPSVIEIIHYLDEYSQIKDSPLFVGYFGDPAQNIYDDGVGKNLPLLHPGLDEIKKAFNRRSYIEIIEVINKIRGGDISQRSIFDDCKGGSAKFYSANERKPELVTSFIEKYRNQWGASTKNPLHCLVLTNKKIAEFGAFPEVFNLLSDTEYYKRQFQQVGTEVLSHDITKLGNVPLVFYKLLKFKIEIENPKTSIAVILGGIPLEHVAFPTLKKLLLSLKRMNGTTLGEYVRSMFQIYKEPNCLPEYRMIVRNILALHEYSYESFLGGLFGSLFPNIDTEDTEELTKANGLLQEILEIGLDQYIRWFRFVTESQESDVIYHTYHGTKGREYENVIIIMEDDFGISKNKFRNFFSNIHARSQMVDANEIAKFENTRNLLYVSCSRAIKNLRILYLDDTSDFQGSIIEIFGMNEIYDGKD